MGMDIAYSTASRLARAASRRWQAQLRVMPEPWQALSAELDRWLGTPARFWWRDDDAVSASPALERLLGLQQEIGVPLALAVIPARLEASLPAAIGQSAHVRVLGHGWDHIDHARLGEEAIELGGGREAQQIREDLARGHAILAKEFGASFLPVLVPPFNRIDYGLATELSVTGYRALSIDGDFTFLPGTQCNVHIDVNNWRTGTALSDAQAVRGLIGALRLRRAGLVARTTPIGVLTHHLVHDAASWWLSTRLLRCLRSHPGAYFPPLQKILAGEDDP